MGRADRAVKVMEDLFEGRRKGKESQLERSKTLDEMRHSLVSSSSQQH